MSKEFISKRFASIRLAHNISARQLSIELGQGTSYINQIECGKKMPSIEGLINFCDYSKISLSDFFDNGKTYPIQYDELIKVLNTLQPDELADILMIAKRVARK